MVITSSNWNYIYDEEFSWVQSVFDLISEVNIPYINGPTIYVTSDYSGDHNKSSYQVISFLFSDLENSRLWEERRKIIRSNYLGNRRRMSFKKLGDTKRKKALTPFLCAANEINGLLVSIAINKKIKNLYINSLTYNKMKNDGFLKGRWKLSSLENMFRIVHFASLLIAGIAKPKQNIYWISDNDPIAASHVHKEDTAKLLSSFTSKYVQFELGELGFGTTDIDEGDFIEEDLTAIPDLVSGALAEYYTCLRKETGAILFTKNSFEFPETLSKKSELIMRWFSDDKQFLKRMTLLLECDNFGGFKVGRFVNLNV